MGCLLGGVRMRAWQAGGIPSPRREKRGEATVCCILLWWGTI